MPPATRPRRLTRKGVLVQQALLWCWHADVAQLVEHLLAKVRVAGSNPVVRSRKVQVRGGNARSGAGPELSAWKPRGRAGPVVEPPWKEMAGSGLR
jgi:hypothetical protein